MKKFLQYRWLWSIILAGSIISGLLVTSSAVSAGDIWYQLYPGLNNPNGNIVDYGFSWTASVLQWENNAETEVDLLYTHYYNGYGDAYNPSFWELWVYDQYGNQVNCFWNFAGYNINGADYQAYTTWDMTELSSSNDHVLMQQMVNYGPSVFSEYIVSTTN